MGLKDPELQAAGTATTLAPSVEISPVVLPPGTCPTNGAVYSSEQQTWWEGHRPLGVVIENSRAARPQSGLSNADIVYEAVAEGGITRFGAIFHCQNPGVVGPIRSARQVTFDMVSAYGDNPLYAHAGGASTADPNHTDLNVLGRIVESGWQNYNDMDALSSGGPFYRDENRLDGVSTEHTMYATTDGLWELANSRGLSSVETATGEPWQNGFRSYSFKAEAPLEQRAPSQSILIPFWGGDSTYDVQWHYDPNTNAYWRWNGGDPHTDLNTGAQIAAKNIVVMQVAETRQADGSHTRHETVGFGQAQIFIDGIATYGTWERPNLQTQPILKDANGNEIQFNPGQIWFEIVGYETPVTVS